MPFLKCNHCGQFNEVKTEYLTFCVSCGKKLDNNFKNWQTRNPDKTFDDFKQQVCVSETDSQKNTQKSKSNKSRGLKYWIGFTVFFAIFYGIVQFSSDKIAGIFRKPSFDEAMVVFASEINKNCPMMIDNATRLDNAVALPNNTFQYNYTVLTELKDAKQIEDLKNYLEPNIVNIVKTEPQMKIIRENRTTVNYNYKNNSGVFLFAITVGPGKYE